jgi:UDP-glucose 4-epimerase
VLALESEATDEFYNVGTGIQTSIKDLCDLILQLRGSSLEVKYKPYLDSDIRQFVQNRIGSTEKAEKYLGFRFRDSLEKGLLDLINWRAEGQTSSSLGRLQ